MKAALPGRKEFQQVYSRGKRYEGKSITAFVLSNHGSYHRLGVTASRKAVGNAVHRNRAKRLLREAFRLNDLALALLRGKYDWVLNANRRVLEHKVGTHAQELATVIEKVARDEAASSTVGL